MADAGVAVGRPLRQSDPTVLGPYTLLRRIGEGGMGSVYLAQRGQGPGGLGGEPGGDGTRHSRAGEGLGGEPGGDGTRHSRAGEGLGGEPGGDGTRHSRAGELVALKVIRRDLSNDPDFRRRFRSEVARAQQVPAFCTAEVLDADPDHDPPYLVVEFVNGPSLARVVQNQGPLSPANLHGLAIGVATALAAIHGAGVIHRDLKPANVLLAPGSPKVIDFGIARATEGGTLTDTGSNQLVGTIAYMAPERLDPAEGHPITPAADIFAWGGVVVFAGTGRTPFGGNGVEAAAKILTQPPDLTGLSGDLRALVERALAKDPARRPTARELLDQLVGPKRNTVDLVEAGSQQAVVTVPAASDTTRFYASPIRPHRRKRRFLVPLLTVGVVMLTAAVVGLMTGKIPPLWADNPPASSPSTSQTIPTSAAPSPTASAGVLQVDETFAAPSALFANDDRWATLKAKCVIDGGLVITKDTTSSYRCPNYLSPVKDFRLRVDVTLKSDSCAAIWFRNTNYAGYLLTVCADKYLVGTHDELHLTNLKTLLLSEPVKAGATFQVTIEMHGSAMTFVHNGQTLGKVIDDTYAKGKVILGINTPGSGAPDKDYQVAFQNLKIWDFGISQP
jgi:eukaryotic-like serine/threonine-protein kinase